MIRKNSRKQFKSTINEKKFKINNKKKHTKS